MIMAVQQKVKPRKRKHKCPPHHFIINSSNVGHCKYCPEVRDFGRLLERAGYGGSKSKKGGKKGKRGKEPTNRVRILATKKSAAAKKRWQNPEYRANQSAAHASLSGRHHKKEEVLI